MEYRLFGKKQMSKLIAASTTGMAMLTAVLAVGIYAGSAIGSLRAEVEYKSQQIAKDSVGSLPDAQKNHLLFALIVGKVANANADVAAIKYHEKAAMVITSYQLNRTNEQFKSFSSIVSE